ncbi:hypothetical protein [Xanthobacter autotrophicus]|uniref:hypothetical protein n=1 Tax=Xanthobacter autotrophicus TaxID=280 RepID=UPI0037285403
MASLTIASISGGTGSYLAARRYVDQHGTDGLGLLFTDTLCEDQDAYRFLIAGAADIMGVALPAGFIPEIGDFPAWEDRPAYKAFVMALAGRARRAIPGLFWIADGRDVWDIYEAKRFLGNSRLDPCSAVLKRALAKRWLDENCAPWTRVIVGIDHEEIERFVGGPKNGGIRAAWAQRGHEALAPLCDTPHLSWPQRLAELEDRGLWLPRLNRLGFAHNNCGGFCCKAGIGHWRDMARIFPERYAYAERREREIREILGNVAMLTDRRGGQKKPMTLEALRHRDLSPDEASEKGGCGCFFGEDAGRATLAEHDGREG